jgi:hypothetical protein
MCYKCTNINQNSKEKVEKKHFTLEKRAKSKYLTFHILKELSKMPSKITESYNNTLLCNSTIVVENSDPSDDNSPKKAKTTYCKNRFCLTCNRIYLANQINKFDAYFKENFRDPYMIVLSKRTIVKTNSDDLRKEVRTYQNELKQILDNFRKQHPDFDYQIISKLEITYNNQKRTFHPHLHILCDTEEVSRFILEKWLKKNKGKALEGAGNKVFALNFQNDNERQKAIKEVFKYTVKPITDFLNDLAKKKNIKSKVTKNGKTVSINGNKIANYVDLDALNMIYESISGLRLLRIYGIHNQDLEKEDFEDQELKATANVQNKPVGVYKWIWNNWYRKEGSEALTDFEPTDYEENIIQYYKNYWKKRPKIKKKRHFLVK